MIAGLAGRGVIATLKRDVDASVLRSLLGNRLTVEADVVYIAVMSRNPELLVALPAAPVWGVRIAVRAAVARNRFTPEDAAAELFPTIPLADLRELCVEVQRPASFRIRARQALSERLEAADSASGA